MPCTRILMLAWNFRGAWFLVEVGLVSHIPHALHGARDGVSSGEFMTFEQGLEHGLRYDVLGQHLDGIGFRDRGVRIVAQFGQNSAKGAARVAVGVFQQRGQADDVALGNPGGGGQPILLIVAGAACPDELGDDGAEEFVDG